MKPTLESPSPADSTRGPVVTSQESGCSVSWINDRACALSVGRNSWCVLVCCERCDMIHCCYNQLAFSKFARKVTYKRAVCRRAVMFPHKADRRPRLVAFIVSVVCTRHVNVWGVRIKGMWLFKWWSCGLDHSSGYRMFWAGLNWCVRRENNGTIIVFELDVGCEKGLSELVIPRLYYVSLLSLWAARWGIESLAVGGGLLPDEHGVLMETKWGYLICDRVSITW